MKKFKRMLAGLACVLAVCLCTPTAFAAKVIVYFDANGGTCTSAAERPNDEGKVGSLPGASMEGYTFDGWYTEPVGGSKVTTSTVFTSDATIYAHWTAKAGTSTVPQPTTQPAATQWQKYVGPALVAGALLTTLLVATMF